MDVVVSVQYQVVRESLYDAFYKVRFCLLAILQAEKACLLLACHDAQPSSCWRCRCACRSPGPAPSRRQADCDCTTPQSVCCVAALLPAASQHPPLPPQSFSTQLTDSRSQITSYVFDEVGGCKRQTQTNSGRHAVVVPFSCPHSHCCCCAAPTLHMHLPHSACAPAGVRPFPARYPAAGARHGATHAAGRCVHG